MTVIAKMYNLIEPLVYYTFFAIFAYNGQYHYFRFIQNVKRIILKSDKQLKFKA